MISSPKNLHPAVTKSLNHWHEMISRLDLSDLEQIVHPDAKFRSPMSVHPYGPRPAMLLALTTVITVFDDFTYHRQLVSDDGLNVVLEFSAKVDGKLVKGIDFVQFDVDGLIVDFEVMARPINGIAALGAAMAERIGDKLPAYKIRE